jgi:hypothetical protein
MAADDDLVPCRLAASCLCACESSPLTGKAYSEEREVQEEQYGSYRNRGY